MCLYVGPYMCLSNDVMDYSIRIKSKQQQQQKKAAKQT